MIRIPSQYKLALKQYKFIDLFCGIGGFHLALQSFGAKCVFASDIDAEARRVYKSNFKIDPSGDIKLIQEKEIPAHDILCAGFPCQAFSVSGIQAGFKDNKTGMLFFEIIRIAKHHKPKLLILENVANLNSHNEGNTIQIITKELEGIGYFVCKKILDSSNFNVPQSRKRLYIVAFRKDTDISCFSFPESIVSKKKLENLLDLNEDGHLNEYFVDRAFTVRPNYQELEKKSKNKRIRIGEIGLGRQGERIYSIKGCATTLSSSSGGPGGRTGLYLVNERVRKLTPRECAKLMGFPAKFKIETTVNQSYRQFGNSIVIDIIQRIVIEVVKVLQEAQDE